jgi:signal transduction histidine kinase
MIALEVRDSGIGIPEDEHHRLFEAFYTGHGDIDHPYSGAGVGLSIADAYIRGHGGSIAVDSSPGLGSTFTVLLPLPPR